MESCTIALALSDIARSFTSLGDLANLCNKKEYGPRGGLVTEAKQRHIAMRLLDITASLLLTATAVAARQKNFDPPHYTNSNHIVELTPATFDDFVYGSNYSTIVEFYAPWCGYCKQLKPEFEKASKEGHHYAQFAAVNCDALANKQLCQDHNVKGFPTMLTFRPPKSFRAHKPRNKQYAVQPYENQRTADGIVNAMKGTVKSFVKKVPAKKLDSWLNVKDKPRVLLLTEKYSAPAIIKTLAVDFMGSAEFFFMTVDTDTVKSSIEEKITQLHDLEIPSIVVLHPEQGVIPYDGKMSKNAIAKFLTQFAIPVEGEFSERHHVFQSIKARKYKSYTDYRKKMKKAAKEAEKEANINAEENALPKDEL